MTSVNDSYRLHRITMTLDERYYNYIHNQAKRTGITIGKELKYLLYTGVKNYTDDPSIEEELIKLLNELKTLRQQALSLNIKRY